MQAASGQTHGAGPFTLRDAFSSTAEKGFSDVHSVCVGPVRGRVETRGVREAPPPRHRVGGPASEGVTFSLLSIRRLLKGGCGRCQGSSATVGATRRPAWRPAVPAWPSPALSPRPVCGAWAVRRHPQGVMLRGSGSLSAWRPLPCRRGDGLGRCTVEGAAPTF